MVLKQKRAEILQSVLDHFLNPHIIRERGYNPKLAGLWSMRKIWFYLRSNVEICFGDSPRPIESGDLIAAAKTYILGISPEKLIALAFLATKMAKSPRLNYEEQDRIYGFKHCCLNIAIMYFTWTKKIVFSTDPNLGIWRNWGERPFLLITPDPKNEYNLSLRFFLNRPFFMDDFGKLTLGKKNNESFTALHLPRMQLAPEVVGVVEKYELGVLFPL